MKRKQLGIIGDNYNLINNIFERIIYLTNADSDQENIIINLIYCHEVNKEILFEKCLYLKNIGVDKILIVSDINVEDIKNIENIIGIKVINNNINLELLVKDFKESDKYE